MPVESEVFRTCEAGVAQGVVRHWVLGTELGLFARAVVTLDSGGISPTPLPYLKLLVHALTHPSSCCGLYPASWELHSSRMVGTAIHSYLLLEPKATSETW